MDTMNTRPRAGPIETDMPLLRISDVSREFPRPSGGSQVVLDGIDFTVTEGEIVGLLGRSGCGKSTLLRIVAGLVPPTRGEVIYRGQAIGAPSKGIAMVFQTFALFPWLTVLQNVQAGLDAQQIPEPESQRRALQAIDLIGLSGFENAYPRELSGGMRQRVGFARAFVVEPDLLLMDEPFSALDVLTAETLRSDLVDLWSQRSLGIRAILMVTHNIEEAVFMCDRILVMSSNPGRIGAEIAVPLPHPRNRLTAAFRSIVDDIYTRMTAGPVPGRGNMSAAPTVNLTTLLPVIGAPRIIGLTDALSAPPFDGSAELSALAAHLHLNVAGLFRVVEVAQMLGFVELREGVLHLTTAGRVLAAAEIQSRSKLFAEHLLRSVPLAAYIRRVLEDRPSHQAPRSRFLEELEDHLGASDAEHTLTAVTGWGRYAEAFFYDHRTRLFSLAKPWELP
jgi:NitT/TauT family transport system ATP-binding protein